MYELTVVGRFAAAHSLRNFKGRCEALHGHNWRVEVTVQGEKLGEADLLFDFGELKALMRQTLEDLDHHFLNEVPPFDQQNPSSELLAKHIYEDIASRLPVQVQMAWVAVWESDDSRALYRVQ